MLVVIARAKQTMEDLGFDQTRQAAATMLLTEMDKSAHYIALTIIKRDGCACFANRHQGQYRAALARTHKHAIPG
jgi:hypothetical protein